jgi:hypothetical protein
MRLSVAAMTAQFGVLEIKSNNLDGIQCSIYRSLPLIDPTVIRGENWFSDRKVFGRFGSSYGRAAYFDLATLDRFGSFEHSAERRCTLGHLVPRIVARIDCRCQNDTLAVIAAVLARYLLEVGRGQQPRTGIQQSWGPAMTVRHSSRE